MQQKQQKCSSIGLDSFIHSTFVRKKMFTIKKFTNANFHGGGLILQSSWRFCSVLRVFTFVIGGDLLGCYLFLSNLEVLLYL